MWSRILIDALAGNPEVQIVLSTSWAREFSFSRARHYLPAALRSRTVGATWHSAMLHDADYRPGNWWDQATRHEQIKRWISRAVVQNWIAIDDQPEGWPDSELRRLIQTHPATGLSDPAVIAQLSQLILCM